MWTWFVQANVFSAVKLYEIIVSADLNSFIKSKPEQKVYAPSKWAREQQILTPSQIGGSSNHGVNFHGWVW